MARGRDRRSTVGATPSEGCRASHATRVSGLEEIADDPSPFFVPSERADSLVLPGCLPVSGGAQLPDCHDHAKPEGRPRAAGHDLILSDGKRHGGDVMMTANLYPVDDGADVTATVAHLSAVGPALDGKMVPRNVERLDVRELEVVGFRRLSFPRNGEAPNAKWQTGETEDPGGCHRRGREPE